MSIADRTSRPRRLALFVLFLLWPVVLVDPSGPSMADSTLLAAIRLVDHGTWTLTDSGDPEVVFRTTAFDISTHEGRIYSGVGPGASVVAAAAYAVLEPAFSLFDDGIVRNERVLGYYLPNARALGVDPPAHFKEMYLLQIALVWLVMAPLFAWLLVRLRDHLIAFGAAPAQATLAGVALGLGTILLYYSSMYSRQGLASLLAWHGILSLMGRPESRSSIRSGVAGSAPDGTRGADSGSGAPTPNDGDDVAPSSDTREGVAPGRCSKVPDGRILTEGPATLSVAFESHHGGSIMRAAGIPPPLPLVVAGCLLGAAIAVEYPSAILAGLSLLFLLPRLSWPRRLLVLAPLAAALFLTGLYHLSAFGSMLSTPYHHRFWLTHNVLTKMGVDLRAFQAGPLLGIGWPDPAVLLQLCFGPYKGIFVYSPALLLGLAGHAISLTRRITKDHQPPLPGSSIVVPASRGRENVVQHRDGVVDARSTSPEVGDSTAHGGKSAHDGGPGSTLRRDSRARLHLLSLVVFGVYLVFNASLGSGLGEHAHHYWGGLGGMWGPRYLAPTLLFLAWGIAGLDWRSRTVRMALYAALALSCVLNVLGALFAGTLMSEFAFGPDLRSPPGQVLKLLFTEGPRVALLDAYGAPSLLQGGVLLALLLLTGLLLRKTLRGTGTL